MINSEIITEFSSIFEEVGKSLDITEKQYNVVVERYEAVGRHLAAQDSILAPYKPEILPQGSFMLGTMIKPIHEEDDLDIDLICKLEGKKPEWTQFDLKKAVGDRLLDNYHYKRMLDEEGRRCWTLVYAEEARFHLDILPAIVGKDYKMLLEKAFSRSELSFTNDLSIRITDKEEANYKTAYQPELWLKSNPLGYARWFDEQADISYTKGKVVREAVKPIPAYDKDKLPLLRVVQILKRHRDIMFNGDEHKPISIIITTLAARAYSKEINIYEALTNIVNKMSSFIEEKTDLKTRKTVKWISNPVNEEENFADKWIDHKSKEENFYKWLLQIKKDINEITSQRSYKILDSLKNPFGNEVAVSAYNNYGIKQRLLRESGKLHMAANTGMLGSVGTVVKNHKFYGK